MFDKPKLVQDSGATDDPRQAGGEPRSDLPDSLIIERHEYILWWALRYVRDEDVAKDLAQEAFLELFRNPDHAIWHDKERFEALVPTVMHRRVIDYCRRAQTRRVGEAEFQRRIVEFPSAWQESPAREQAENELRDAAEQAVNDLSPRSNAIYRLYLNGVKHKKIAEQLDLKASYTEWPSRVLQSNCK